MTYIHESGRGRPSQRRLLIGGAGRVGIERVYGTVAMPWCRVRQRPVGLNRCF